jgi:hypothetical protein
MSAGDCERHALAPRWRQFVGSAAIDHYAAVLRGLGAAAREHDVGGSRRTGEKLPERACELIGYSIHPPFMGMSMAFTPSD